MCIRNTLRNRHFFLFVKHLGYLSPEPQCGAYSVQTPSPWHEIPSPWANLDHMQALLVIQRCQRSCCLKEADLGATLNLIIGGWSCWTTLPEEYAPPGKHLDLLSPRYLPRRLTYYLSSDVYPRFSFSSLNTHLLFSSFPPGELDSRMLWACLAKVATTSVSEPNIYICLTFICFPILCFSSSRAADCRLNIGHAGVLLVERRGSYPLIDLRILKSKCPDSSKC